MEAAALKRLKELEAFERYIMKFGLAETSLERVAQAAGISRTTIHHYIGGREELFKAAYTRFIGTWLEGIDRLADVDIDDLADYMMAGWIEEAGDRLIIVDELDNAFSHDSEISTAAAELFAYIYQCEAVHLQCLYPTASLEKCQEAGMLLYTLGMGLFRLSKHTELPSIEGLRSSMKGILDNLLSSATG
jgi:AcrR family transcriptional regulator